MTSVSELQRQWDSDLSTRQSALAELQAQRQPLQDAMAAFEATKGVGLWNKLGHNFRSATAMRDTKQKLEKLDKLEEGMDYAFSVIVQNTASQLRAAALEKKPGDGRALREENKAINDALALLPGTEASLQTAVRSCNFARWEENGWSMPMRREDETWTGIAVAAINDAKTNLRALRQIIPETPRLPPDMLGGLQPGDTAGNKDILRSAATSIAELKTAIIAFTPALKERQAEILTQSLETMRQEDPGIGRLYASIRKETLRGAVLPQQKPGLN